MEDKSANEMDVSTSAFILLFTVGFAYFTYSFLPKNKDRMLEEKFKKRYGDIYTNLRHWNNSPVTALYWPFFFCLKRLLVAALSVILKDFSWG